LTERDILIVVDCGTSGLKVGAVSRHVQILGHYQESYPTYWIEQGGAEQEPEDWWDAFRRGLHKLFGLVPDLKHRVAGLVFSAQMCGVICVDESGKPLRRCLIWVDKRSAQVTAKLTGGFPEIFHYNAFKLAKWVRLANGAPSHNGMDPPGKMLWIQQNEPEIWQRTHKLLDPKDWLVSRATGRFVTTFDSANLTWMMDTRRGRMNWSSELTKLVGVSRHLLPEICDGASIAGQLAPNAAVDLGLDAKVLVFCGCGDVTAMALGSGAVEDGELHLHMGTSSWIGGFFPGRRLAVTQGYATIASAAGGRPLLIATQESAGACFEWVARLLGGNTPSDETMGNIIDVALAQDQGSTPMFLPWLAGERVPIDDHRLRGAFLGLSLVHNRHSIVKAVAEGIALNTRWAFAAVSRQPGAKTHGLVRLLGGAGSSVGLCQLLANCLGRDLAVPKDPHLAGIRGAAKLGGAGLGWIPTPWHSPEDWEREAEAVFYADPSKAFYFDSRYDLYIDAFQRTAPWFRRAFERAKLNPAGEE
jgi:xylulokinase